MEKAMAPHSSTLAWKIHGQRSLVGCSPWGRWRSDKTERLHFDFSLSCIGEGNGNPLQCSCLENPRDGGAWWAVASGVAQSRTRLKWLSSSSSRIYISRKWKPTTVFLPGESYRQRSLAGYSPWGQKELDMTEQLNNNNQAIYLCLYLYLITDSMDINLSKLKEIVEDRGAWWATVHGIVKSQSRFNSWTTIPTPMGISISILTSMSILYFWCVGI